MGREEMHKDMHVLYFYGIVTSSQVMPTMMKKISNTVHTIALVSAGFTRCTSLVTTS